MGTPNGKLVKMLHFCVQLLAKLDKILTNRPIWNDLKHLAYELRLAVLDEIVFRLLTCKIQDDALETDYSLSKGQISSSKKGQDTTAN